MSSLTIARVMVIACGAAFVLVVAWLHGRRRDLDPRTTGISHYASGATMTAATAAFLLLALALASAAAVVRFTAAGPSGLTPGVVFLYLAAAGMLVVAVTPVPADPEAHQAGLVHNAGGALFFVSSAAGSVAVSGGSVSAPGVVAWLVAVLVALFLSSLGGVAPLTPVRGWLQRACFASVVLWIMLL
jgi:hypothetical protein